MTLLQIYEPGETPNPHEKSVAIGIDLGTTHSVVAIASAGKATVLHDMCGGALVPSIVHYGDNEIKVGKEASKILQAGGASIASIKRLMGRSFLQTKNLNFPYPLAEGINSLPVIKIGDRSLTAIEISAEILKHLKSLAEKALEQEVTQAVITVPAYFDDAARQATKDAARLAGLEVLRLINEPTAAALAYGLDKDAEGIYAIYDLGGGTFDISILKLEKQVFQVLATAGDTALGGDDFDHLIANHISQDATPALLAKARQTKEKLSQADSANIELKTITRSEFNQLIAPLIEKSLAICSQALEDTKLNKQEIKGVVLVGGSTRIPYLVEKVAEFFGVTPLTDINPDEVVAVGAAIQAAGLTEGSDNLLLDVVPLSLGLETMGGIAEKIIYRNTPIPVAVTQEFTTYQDGQNAMIIHVVQGERELVEQNRSLAKFELVGIPNLPAGIARVKITFAIDADGLLSVCAQEETTGIEQNITVKPSSGLGEEDIEKMLLESMEFAKQDIIARLLREAEIEAARSIEEVKSAFKDAGDLLSDNERAAILKQIEVLENAVLGGDRDLIDFEREHLYNLTRNFAERRMDKAIAQALTGVRVDKAV